MREKTVKAIARYVSPMRPSRVPKLPPDNSHWLYEPTLDGYRAIAVKNTGKPTLYSKGGQIYDKNFPKVLDALSKTSYIEKMLWEAWGEKDRRPV
jgi:ATP-dependent DNA ligase